MTVGQVDLWDSTGFHVVFFMRACFLEAEISPDSKPPEGVKLLTPRCPFSSGQIICIVQLQRRSFQKEKFQGEPTINTLKFLWTPCSMRKPKPKLTQRTSKGERFRFESSKPVKKNNPPSIAEAHQKSQWTSKHKPKPSLLRIFGTAPQSRGRHSQSCMARLSVAELKSPSPIAYAKPDARLQVR